MDLEQVALDDGFDGDDALNNQGIGVLHVKVHERHHGDTHQLATPGLAKLVEVVGADRGSNKLALFGGAHRCGFNVLEGGHVWREMSVLAIVIEWSSDNGMSIRDPPRVLL